MFVEPHFGQNFILPKTGLYFLVLSIDFLKPPFSFNRLPNSLNLNSLASFSHNGQCCPGCSCLSYVHLMFGQVHVGMITLLHLKNNRVLLPTRHRVVGSRILGKRRLGYFLSRSQSLVSGARVVIAHRGKIKC